MPLQLTLELAEAKRRAGLSFWNILSRPRGTNMAGPQHTPAARSLPCLPRPRQQHLWTEPESSSGSFPFLSMCPRASQVMPLCLSFFQNGANLRAVVTISRDDTCHTEKAQRLLALIIMWFRNELLDVCSAVVPKHQTLKHFGGSALCVLSENNGSQL